MVTDNTLKIAAFQESVLKEIGEEIDTVIANAEKSRQETAKRTQEELIYASYKQISHESKFIKIRHRKRVSKSSFDAHRGVLAERSRLVDGFFEKLSARLLAFAEGASYRAFFEAALKEAEAVIPFYEGVIVEVGERDYAMFAKNPPEGKFTLKPARKIKLGGPAVFYPKERLYFDLTLDKRLESERKSFVHKSELQI